MELKYEKDTGEDCLLSVDCTDCEICEPGPYVKRVNKKWYSFKYKGPGLRYEVALVIKTGLIAWVNGPFPCGSFPDHKIFKYCGLKDALDINERVKADGGYKSLDPQFCKTPYGYTSIAHPERKRMASRVRARHETINRRLKKFNILTTVYRHSKNDHMDAFHAVCVVVQVEMLNGEPLFQIENYT